MCGPTLCKHISAVCTFLIAGLLWSGDARSSSDEFSWRAGVSKRVITPETTVWLAGYGEKRVPTGQLHDLWMKALALEDKDGKRVVLITSDFQGVPKSMSDVVFQRLQAELGLARDQVMLTFSHNHCGPRLGDDLVDYYPYEPKQEELIAAYTVEMQNECVALVREAIANLAPAELEQGCGVTTFAVNRRNNSEETIPQLIAEGRPLAGPVDHDVPVLTITRDDGQIAAILFGYACHPTTLRFTKWCGDYPGFAQLELERRHPETVAMFVNTCGGDQNPLPRREVELCERYGQMLANAVDEVLALQRTPVAAEVVTSFRYVELAYQKVVNRTDLTEATASNHTIKRRWAGRMLQKLNKGEEFPSTYPYPIHAWRLGHEMLVIGMGAETVVDYALRFKKTYGKGTWVCGYADDMVSYIPSHRVWLEGGYEGGMSLFEYGRPAFSWAEDVEDRIVATVQREVEQVGWRPKQ